MTLSAIERSNTRFVVNKVPLVYVLVVCFRTLLGTHVRHVADSSKGRYEAYTVHVACRTVLMYNVKSHSSF